VHTVPATRLCRPTLAPVSVTRNHALAIKPPASTRHDISMIDVIRVTTSARRRQARERTTRSHKHASAGNGPRQIETARSHRGRLWGLLKLLTRQCFRKRSTVKGSSCSKAGAVAAVIGQFNGPRTSTKGHELIKVLQEQITSSSTRTDRHGDVHVNLASAWRATGRETGHGHPAFDSFHHAQTARWETKLFQLVESG